MATCTIIPSYFGGIAMNVEVRTGADGLAASYDKLLRGRRFGLLTNPTGINSRYRSTIDLCRELAGSDLAAFFACEHGLRGEKQAGVRFEDAIDPVYGLPVYSLYGTRRKPTAEMLAGLDAVVFDIQDLGIRFYTYLSTLVYTMQACAEQGVALIVLDRPNPLGGYRIEGGLLQDGFHSMVGAWPIPVATGLTIGEFARMVNAELPTACELHIVPLQGWKRQMEFPDTGLPWVMPSPNMPTMDTVRVYAGNCLFEGTNVSEGRGTTKPFEMVGAPWVRHEELCGVMNGLGLPGVHYHPVTFTPTFQKHAGELCNGVMTYVTDSSVFRSAESGLYLLHYIAQLHPDQLAWRGEEDGHTFLDILSGSDVVRRTIREPGSVQAILDSWEQDQAEWSKRREPYLLYE